MDRSQSFRLQADMIVVSASQVLAPGRIELRAGRIADVSADTRRAADVVLEGYALLPGLVNPHTHLEFSDLPKPLPPGQNFPDWIGLVLQQRRARGCETDRWLADALAAGLSESRDAGVAALVDIVTPPWTPEHLLTRSSAQIAELPAARWSRLPVDLQARISLDQWQRMQESLPQPAASPAVIACLEQLGLTPDRIAAAAAWREQVECVPQSAWPTCLRDLGLSPHAPYSTRESLVRDVAGLAARRRCLIAMHMAESPAEREWIDSGTGPFVELFERLGVHQLTRSKSLIVDACHALAEAPRALLIHGNYLNEAEMDAIAMHRQNLSVVFCPRTHRHFEHAAYPLAAFLSRGIRVVLGTDSRSSNPDLNLWQEARTALLTHSCLRPSQALAAITDQSAESIGCRAHYGSLRPGRVAALNAIPLGNVARPDKPADLEDLLGGWFENVPHPIPLL